MNVSTISLTTTINVPIKFYFQGLPGGTDLTTLVVVNEDTIIISPVITITAIGITGLYSINFTPTLAGKWIVMLDSIIIAYIDAVIRTPSDMIKNLEDESLGSWIWDKTAGTLSMVRQDGTSLANFTVIESLLTASRERV